MRKLLLSFALFAVTGSLIVSCKKGDTGPEGPAGPAGPVGAAGPAGPIGTANVIYSNWFKFVAADWADTTLANFGTSKRANKATASMTQAILDNGVLLAYAKYDEAGTLAGPFTLPLIIPSGTTQIILNTIPAVGRVVYYNYTFPAAGGIAVNAAYQYRYIIIPGGVSGRGETPTYGGYTAEELKTMPYSQVASLFEVPSTGSNE